MFVPLVGMPQGAEWLIILAIVILVFGAAKLPDLARGTGQALRIFKAETKGLKDDDSDAGADSGAGTRAAGTTAELPAADEKPVEGEIVEPRRDTNAG